MPFRHTDPIDSGERHDVCVIGAGIAGSVLAHELAGAGLQVAWVDGRHAPGISPDAYEYCGHPEYPSRLRRRARSWSAETLARWPTSDFRSHPYNGGLPWPLSSRDLDPHYDAIEDLLHTVTAPAGGLADGGEADTALGDLLRGYGIDGTPLAKVRPGRNADPLRRIADRARAAAGCCYLRGAIATQLIANANGRVSSVVVRTPDGQTQALHADAFIVAAGAMGSARLLLASRSPHHPHGLGNDHGVVGRYVHDQAIIVAVGEAASRSNRWPRGAGAIHTAQFHQAFRRAELGAVHPYFAPVGVLEMDRHFGDARSRLRAALTATLGARIGIECRIEIKPVVTNRLSLSPQASDPFGHSLGRLHFACSREDVELIQRARIWAEKWLERLGAGRHVDSRLSWSGTLGGTARIGTDPTVSVCDATLRVHSSPNLFMCGAPTLPRAGAVPAALTVAAMAHRLAAHVHARARWLAKGRDLASRAWEPAPSSGAQEVPRARP